MFAQNQWPEPSRAEAVPPQHGADCALQSGGPAYNPFPIASCCRYASEPLRRQRSAREAGRMAPVAPGQLRGIHPRGQIAESRYAAARLRPEQHARLPLLPPPPDLLTVLQPPPAAAPNSHPWGHC